MSTGNGSQRSTSHTIATTAASFNTHHSVKVSTAEGEPLNDEEISFGAMDETTLYRAYHERPLSLNCCLAWTWSGDWLGGNALFSREDAISLVQVSEMRVCDSY